ncbi:MAG TPA: low affinity iron permease family protein [Bryobacteraceae bacterium]|jgi:low affinity Fe/Cu permease|nr:low affinity iron permease family protein [Bryobacteraceae bacterium]
MLFRKLALKASQVAGSALAFWAAVIVTLIWIASGPYFHFSDTWQLVINTATSVATFLIVFLIQNTQNRDTAVIQLKLDELIRAVKQARTELVQMEGLSDEELDHLREEFRELRERATLKLDEIEASRSKRVRNSQPNGVR